MAHPATVSACIVLYHAGDEVLRAVQCVKASTLPVDLFVSDNSPECDTAQRIKALWPQVRILTQQANVGFGRGNNAALPHLQSRYHLLVNPDVTFPPELIERMVAYMDAHPEAVILTPRVFNQDGTEQFLPKKQPT
ncbi:MAG: glycosyltransferase, partial [Aristaeellaceae bacterium]